MQLHPDVVYNCLLTEENPSHTLRRLIMLEKMPMNMMPKGFYTSVVWEKQSFRIGYSQTILNY